MKRVIMGLTLAMGLLSTTGCHLLEKRGDCNSCNGNLGCRPCNLGWQRGGTDYQRHLGHNQHSPAGSGGASGGQMAQVAYPYYTVRGPRDFLSANPPSIGR